MGVTIYGNSGKHISVLCVLEWFFNVNSNVAVIMSSGDNISVICDMVIFRHHFSV